jgi:hypothetical protein
MTILAKNMSQTGPHAWDGSTVNQERMIAVLRKSNAKNGMRGKTGFRANRGISQTLNWGGYDGKMRMVAASMSHNFIMREYLE